MSQLTQSTNVPLRKASRNDRRFDAWAESYDTQANPLLMLEKRYLETMLPEITGRDVLDAGCGSGRWLSYFAKRSPRRLRGIDRSSAMLQGALGKKIPDVELLQCSCDETPFEERSFDLILSSFVLSYVEDIYEFAVETDRIARNGCHLFVSDMHPETQGRLGWRRSFRDGANEIELKTVRHELREIVTIFTSLGWELCAAIEPGFGTPEHEVFADAGRLNRFDEADGWPAIYLLHLRKSRGGDTATEHRSRTIVRCARCALGAKETIDALVEISGERISHILSDRFSAPGAACGVEIDLSGYLMMPGLINAHDHLEFALFPRLANPEYPNATAWARNIHECFADVIAAHRAVPRDVRLWWGGLRNLLCGVTTVCHHNPLEAELQRQDFPVRVIQEFGWAHSLTFGGDLRGARSAAPHGSAFIVHACEGVDDEARKEIWELDRLGILDADTVIVHGLAIDREGAALMRERGGSLIVCPSSNHFLFGRVPDLAILELAGRLALGSDSPLTAVGDLLDEVHFAERFCGLQSQVAYDMVTAAPAAILHLPAAEGSIRIGGRGDLIAVRDTGCDAAERLHTLSSVDVELVMIGGRVHLASEAVMERLPESVKEGLEPLGVDGAIRWLRAPTQELLRRAEDALGAGNVRLGGKPIRIPARVEAQHVR
ncbi:MAG: methyltransferase domain-containing protein [Terracidiphilus sp.]|jgi:cytosine/adenosine deaminase-related metal-dependent hydrolase/ubiquinone/menaquinone biosynthesis C-methylase UbiE